MVRNERDPQGSSISERYGRPVTAADVEDLLYSERVPSGTIYKVMRAVHQAIIWSRTQAVRPWAGDLEDGLTRQEERRREQRHERQRNELGRFERTAEESGSGGGSQISEAPSVNTPEVKAEKVWAQAVLDMRDREAAARPQEASQDVVVPFPGTTSPPAVPEPATALSGPQEADEEAYREPIRVFAEIPVEELTLDEVFAEAAALAAGNPPPDAPAEPAAPPVSVATGLAAVTVPPAASEGATGLSEPQAADKACVKCGKTWPLDFFQREGRAPDGRKARCKQCTARADATRRSLKRSLKRALKAGEEAQAAADSRAEALQAVQEPRKPLVPARVLLTAPKTLSVPLRAVWDVPAVAVPDAGGALRTCKSCLVPKVTEAYYVRQDGRTRFVCIECERNDARQRRLAAKERRAAASA